MGTIYLFNKFLSNAIFSIFSQSQYFTLQKISSFFLCFEPFKNIDSCEIIQFKKELPFMLYDWMMRFVFIGSISPNTSFLFLISSIFPATFKTSFVTLFLPFKHINNIFNRRLNATDYPSSLHNSRLFWKHISYILFAWKFLSV